MAVKQQLLESLGRAHHELMRFVDTLPDAERAAVGTEDQWAAKDVVAHSVVWSKRLMDRLDAAARGETVSPVGEIDHENAAIFHEYHGESWDAIRQLAVENAARVAEYVSAADEGVLVDPDAAPAGFQGELWKRFAGNCITHTLLHLGQYYVERGQAARAVEVGELMGDLLLSLDDAPDWRGVSLYNLACVYALTGQKEAAISRLGESLALNDSLVEWSKEDTDLDSLREDPAFKALYA